MWIEIGEQSQIPDKDGDILLAHLQIVIFSNTEVYLSTVVSKLLVIWKNANQIIYFNS